jgi:hypothetical protein
MSSNIMIIVVTQHTTCRIPHIYHVIIIGNTIGNWQLAIGNW